MLYTVCSVRDIVAKVFGKPFFVQSTPVAVRSFQDELNRPSQPGEQSLLQQHPGDFELYDLGQFDEDSASFSQHPQPLLLVRGSDLIQPRT